jgi:XTP/dITP diphosphohydrolase
MQNTILISSQNPGKIDEITAILTSVKLKKITPQDIALTIHPKETGRSYAENARIKAIAYRDASGLPALADDSGLEVDVLGGAPGIFSARFSKKPNATDSDRRAYLLEILKDFPQPWNAHFHCTAILATPDNTFIETTGRCDGVIIPDECGSGGFGYDPIFFIPERQATMAELPQLIKNNISHRALALLAMMPFLKAITTDSDELL